jgi:hypothetical protein
LSEEKSVRKAPVVSSLHAMLREKVRTELGEKSYNKLISAQQAISVEQALLEVQKL